MTAAGIANADVELIPPENLAAYAPTEYQGIRTAMKAVNDNGMSPDGLTHNTDQTLMWMSENSAQPGWFIVDLGEAYLLDRMKTWNFNMASFSYRGTKEVDIYLPAAADPSRPPNFADSSVWTLFQADAEIPKAPG